MEVPKGEASSATKRVEEVKEKAKRDMEMAVRRFRRMKAFHLEADSNYLAGLNECRTTIMKTHLEIDFSFIAFATNT